MGIQVHLSVQQRARQLFIVGHGMPPVQLMSEQLGMIVRCGSEILLHACPLLCADGAV